MLALILFLSGDDFGMEHGSIAEIGPIFPCEHPKREFRLLDHWSADQEWEFEWQFVDHIIQISYSFISSTNYHAFTCNILLFPHVGRGGA